MLHHEHLKTTDITEVPLSASLAAAALTTGQVDAAIVNYAYVPGAIASGAHVVATSIQNGISVPAAGAYYANTQDLKNPAFVAALKDFLARTVRYESWVAKNQGQVAADYVQFLDEPATLASASAHSATEQFYPITPAVISGEQAAANLLHNFQAYPDSVNVSINYDTRFNAAIATPSASVTK
jgi:ABC-type nitrate/sulfonate/bicarbonate transport system substrate-binding protein